MRLSVDDEVFILLTRWLTSDFSPDKKTEKIKLKKLDHSIRSVPLHRHKYIEIVYIEAGKGYHLIAGNKYEVVKGDCLDIIARKFCTTARALRADNNLEDGSLIKVKQKIVVRPGRKYFAKK